MFQINGGGKKKVQSDSEKADKEDLIDFPFAEILFVAKMKLGHTHQEALHIYIGEYMDQFEIFKKYHNMEMTKHLFSGTEKEEEVKEEQPPEWVVEAERIANGK